MILLTDERVTDHLRQSLLVRFRWRDRLRILFGAPVAIDAHIVLKNPIDTYEDVMGGVFARVSHGQDLEFETRARGNIEDYRRLLREPRQEK
jgi:hypothetical protein